jgi:hypothetical protein
VLGIRGPIGDGLDGNNQRSIRQVKAIHQRD